MSFKNELRKRFKRSFDLQIDEALTQAFNCEVGNKGWTFARSVYLSCLKEALSQRNIDISVVCNQSGGLNLRQKVKLVNQSFVFLEN